MYLMKTTDNRYAVVVSVEKNVNDYDVYELFDNPIIDEVEILLNVDTFLYYAKKYDITPHINHSINADGCCNFNGMADNIMTHFCNKSHIDSYYRMIVECYDDANKRFNFIDTE